jgi:hypothetical protein
MRPEGLSGCRGRKRCRNGHLLPIIALPWPAYPRWAPRFSLAAAMVLAPYYHPSRAPGGGAGNVRQKVQEEDVRMSMTGADVAASKPRRGAVTTPRKPTGRSKVTNGVTILHGLVDGRSHVARRYRDLLAAVCVDQGGANRMSEAEPAGSQPLPCSWKRWKRGLPTARTSTFRNTPRSRRRWSGFSHG